MNEILEYIKQNSTLFLIALGLISLAIIGYYADKTNFGQKKIKDKDSKDETNEKKEVNPIDENKILDEPIQSLSTELAIEDPIETLSTEQMMEQSTETSKVEQLSNENNEIGDKVENINFGLQNETAEINNQANDLIISETINTNYEDDYLSDKLNSNNTELINNEQNSLFDSEINSLLPKKELINSDLLNEIEGMEFNSIKEKKLFDVPNLDNISLPKIKNLVEKEQDIWKF